MGWLEDEQEKLNNEIADKLATDYKLREAWEHRNKTVVDNTQWFAERCFYPYEGKPTKSLQTVVVKVQDGVATIYQDDDLLATVRYFYKEGTRYADDTGGYGCMGGTGEYYLTAEMTFNHAYTDEYNIRRPAWTSLKLDETNLARYLLQFIIV